MDEVMTGWLSAEVYGNSILQWFVAPGVALLVFFGVLLLKRWVVYRLSRLTRRTRTELDDLIPEIAGRTRSFLILVIAIWAGSNWLDLPPKLGRFLEGAAVLAALLQVALWAAAGIDLWVERYRRRQMAADAAATTTVVAMRFIGKLVLFSLILLLALDNLGFDVTALVAGLGVGGIAVALALQNILGDLFASLSIVLDKPFVIGDFIIVGDMPGTVENIGLKTTRVKSLSGEQLVFSNSDLLSSRIRNFKRMAERRILFGFGVTYQTPAAQVEKIPGMVKEIIESQEQTRLDRAHFKGFGDSSLDFEVVYYVTVPEYNVYMDRQQAINLALMRAFEKEGIEFAYPTRTLFVAKNDSPQPELPA